MQIARQKVKHAEVNEYEEIQPLIIPPLAIEESAIIDEEMPNQMFSMDRIPMSLKLNPDLS